MITEIELQKFSPNTSAILIPIVTGWFNKYAEQYNVTTPLRVAAFFSQVIHESGSFKYVHEIASGDAYEGRKDLGNVFPGDGRKFKGRGYIQITGSNNYAAISKDLFHDVNVLLKNPEQLATPQYAMLSAFWFWGKESLNDLADKAFLKTITKRINGGYNGWSERVVNYNRICDLYNIPNWHE